MKTRISISNRLFAGFSLVVVLVIVCGLIIVSNINTQRDLSHKAIHVFTPGHDLMIELAHMLEESWYLTQSWVNVPSEADDREKKRLEDIHGVEYTILMKKVEGFQNSCNSETQDKIQDLLISVRDTIFPQQQMVMMKLGSLEDYQNEQLKQEALELIDKKGILYEKYSAVLSDIKSMDTFFKNENERIDNLLFTLFNRFKNIIIISIIIILLIIIIVGISTYEGITKPLSKLKQHLVIMSKGVLPDQGLKETNDEFGDMANAVNGYVESMRNTANFATKIGEGDYSLEFSALGKEDAIGNALLNMRTNLINAQKDYERRAKADEVRNWTAKGLAEFADILRQNSNNMDELSRSIMTNLIDYLEVNQGAIYILNQDDETNPYFEMKSAIAYGREKFLKRNFEMQEGLVGRCAFEKMPVYLREIPEDYINITSGLGTAEPDFLLLVPLQINEKVMGVVEIASFNEIPEHQIEFVKALGENIASTISNVRINEKTKVLLEESRLRGDELSAQEEELRQNMEELQATQEEAARREREMLDTIEAINNTMGTVELDKNGLITAANDNFLEKIRFDASSLIGKSFRELFIGSNDLENDFLELWSGLQVGESGSLITNFITQDGELWFKHTFSSFRDSAGDFSKAVDLIIDITDRKKLERELEDAKINL